MVKSRYISKFPISFPLLQYFDNRNVHKTERERTIELHKGVYVTDIRRSKLTLPQHQPEYGFFRILWNEQNPNIFGKEQFAHNLQADKSILMLDDY